MMHHSPEPNRDYELLMQHYAQVAARWLARELGGERPRVERRGTALELRVGRLLCRLRFSPQRCRWSVEIRQEDTWLEWAPEHPCLSLQDWLGEVRRLATRKAGGAVRSKENGTCVSREERP